MNEKQNSCLAIVGDASHPHSDQAYEPEQPPETITRREQGLQSQDNYATIPRWSLLSVFFELKRRGVLAAGTSYIVAAWLIAQVAGLIVDTFGTPSWVLQALLIALAIGLPVAILVSWAFELTPRGLKRENVRPGIVTLTQFRGRGLLCAMMAILVLTIAVLLVDRDVSVCSL